MLVKRIIAMFLFLGLFVFSGCTNQAGNNDTTETSTNTAETSTDTAETSAVPDDTDDITSDITPEVNEDIMPEVNDYIDEFGYYIEYEKASYDIASQFYTLSGYSYLAYSDQESKNSYDNPELFDDEGNIPQYPTPEKSQYFRANVGDRFGELTLSEASVSYYPFVGTQYAEPNNYLWISTAAFEGEITLKGYIRANIDDDAAYEENGEIIFIPDSTEWNGYPIPYTESTYFGWYADNDFCCVSSAPILSLGILYDYDIDTSAIPDDGSLIRAEVKISDIALFYVCSDYGFRRNSATLMSVKAL